MSTVSLPSVIRPGESLPILAESIEHFIPSIDDLPDDLLGHLKERVAFDFGCQHLPMLYFISALKTEPATTFMAEAWSEQTSLDETLQRLSLATHLDSTDELFLNEKQSQVSKIALLALGLSTEMLDRSGSTSFHVASTLPDREVMSAVVHFAHNEHGANTRRFQKRISEKAGGWDTPLVIAASRGHISSVQTLLEAGIQKQDAEDALIAAREREQVDVVAHLENYLERSSTAVLN